METKSTKEVLIFNKVKEIIQNDLLVDIPVEAVKLESHLTKNLGFDLADLAILSGQLSLIYKIKITRIDLEDITISGLITMIIGQESINF